MPDFVVTGKKGNGKTLSMIDLIYRLVNENRIIATNLDLNLEHLFSPGRSQCKIIRVPDLPSSQDLQLIGEGNPTTNEDMNGALILDELAISMNSRNYQDKDRQNLINWLVLARKLGWDVYYLVQDISMIDKQVREGLAEHVVYCRRLDRINVPFLGTLWKFATGCKLRAPRMHIATVKYGAALHAPLADRWTYRGDKYFKAYDTRQKFRADYPHGCFSYLPPSILLHRSRAKRNGEFYMRLTKILIRKWSRVGSFVAGSVAALLLVSGVAYSQYQPVIKTASTKPKPAKVLPVTDEEKELFKDAKIISYISLPGKIPVFYIQADKENYSSEKLISQGFTVSHSDFNSIEISKGDYHATIYNN